jgi:hypothetical protein
MLAMKALDISQLEILLLLARENNYTADELDILLHILPVHIGNQSISTNQLLEEAKRVRKLGLELLNVLSAAEFNRQYPLSIMQQAEEFFRVLPHPNPEMKVVQRTDWLDRSDYRPSAARPGQLEVRRDVFLSKAIAFLGRKVVECMIGVVDRIAQPPALSTITLDERRNSIFTAITYGKEILSVSQFIL